MDEHQGSAPCIPVEKVCTRPIACISQHLCSEKWNPVLESHQPLRFCKPPPELLGQRDRNRKCRPKLSPPPALLRCLGVLEPFATREQSSQSLPAQTCRNQP